MRKRSDIWRRPFSSIFRWVSQLSTIPTIGQVMSIVLGIIANLYHSFFRTSVGLCRYYYDVQKVARDEVRVVRTNPICPWICFFVYDVLQILPLDWFTIIHHDLGERLLDFVSKHLRVANPRLARFVLIKMMFYLSTVDGRNPDNGKSSWKSRLVKCYYDLARYMIDP